jgi:hypothetical protein
MVGSGTLKGTVSVDQVYAQNQHESLNFRHPHGGRAKYLEQPLFENHEHYLRWIADSVLEDGGQHGMIRAMDDLAGDGGVATNAPIEFGYLRGSGHPVVRSGEEVVYDRPPLVERLTEDQLRAISRSKRRSV